ncbi:site-specific DNA-methyltransferase [Clavibacter lycopersici]|uniref:Methyltransferase n=1 Tax=Clavibacter lycopersici TaxID=2301718 RepID=A0A399T639_9MICO|nr:site-specific DNA-methyltransferase [Clavibacter lycopersici]RIJ49637.1 site-specific DNA-methyltransferase [Clavibacter lycopersici]RIJ61008.1 site-specific DNA-methyltransferase [Clavibacter lycopersici]
MPQLDHIIHGDCIVELKKLKDHSVDLVILDPPYWKIVNERWDFEWRTKNEYVDWCLEWLTEVSRVIKRSGSLYIFGYTRNLVYLYASLAELGFTFRQEIVIDKGLRSLGGRKTSTYKMFPTTTETVWFFQFNSKPFIKDFLKTRQKALGLKAYEINQQLGVKANGGGVWSLYTGNNILAQVPTEEMWGRLQEVLQFDMPWSEVGATFNIEMGYTNVWTDINFYSERRHHPTQKPIPLIERIIKASTNPGMVVLDPFMGSGTTALACLNLNRHFIGIEKDEEYVRISERRISSHSVQDTLDY